MLPIVTVGISNDVAVKEESNPNDCWYSVVSHKGVVRVTNLEKPRRANTLSEVRLLSLSSSIHNNTLLPAYN